MPSRIYAVFTEYDKSVFLMLRRAKIHRNNGLAKRLGRDISTMAEGLPEESLGRLRVLYVSALEPDYYGEYRLRALRRLGLWTMSQHWTFVPMEYLASLASCSTDSRWDRKYSALNRECSPWRAGRTGQVILFR